MESMSVGMGGRKPLGVLEKNTINSEAWTPARLTKLPGLEVGKVFPGELKKNIVVKGVVQGQQKLLGKSPERADAHGSLGEEKNPVVRILQDQLNQMQISEEARREDYKRLMSSLERKDLEARENALKVQRTIAELRDAEELRRDAEVIRNESMDALKMKSGLLKRISKQTDRLLHLDEENKRLAEELENRTNELAALECMVNNNTTIPNASMSMIETAVVVEDKHGNESAKIRALECQLACAEEQLIQTSVEGIMESMVTSIGLIIDHSSKEQETLSKHDLLRSELDSLLEFSDLEKHELEAYSTQVSEEMVELKSKLAKMEVLSRKAEQESKLTYRKVSRKVEVLREELESAEKKAALHQQECRTLRETTGQLETDRDLAKNTLEEVRRQHNSAIETARREIVAKKEELERERRLRESSSENIKKLASENKRLVGDLKSLSDRLVEIESENERNRSAPRNDEEISALKKKLTELEGDLKRSHFKQKILENDNESLRAKAEMEDENSKDQEIKNMKEQVEQYKAFARRYKERADTTMADLTEKWELAKKEVKRHWSTLSKLPELRELSRLVLEVSDQNEQRKQARSRRMSVI
ncbi:hypothetical protein NDN08_003662 [Rhodosorus marinus]|uniref:Uncharacterized protein n=1 Tax=Rhodosorus marinus TaxID=101924 RepID=A0AAV8UYA0_9RHOD|nr:hypothetical protein NDN08_003662 [Rhodosorus marinus]